MATITLDGTDFETYADVAEADEYLAGDFGATIWRAETSDDLKGRALVTATRILDRMVWAGEKEDVDQLLAWPRTGTGATGVEDDVIPQDIISASIVLAKLVHSGSSVDSSSSTESNIRSQRAGSVAIEYFRISEDPTRLPTEVHELIRRFLGGSGAVAGVIAHGTCGESITCENHEPGIGF